MNSQSPYDKMLIGEEKASLIAKELYSIAGKCTKLNGEYDLNYKIDCGETSYILKISRPDENFSFLRYQQDLLKFLSQKKEIYSPCYFNDKEGNAISEIIDENGKKRYVRLLSWIEGRVWSSINPISDALLIDLGKKAGSLTSSLRVFKYPSAERKLEWDIAQVLWTKNYIHLFPTAEAESITYFLDLFLENYDEYSTLRKQVVHNDVNDNNIIVSQDKLQPEVLSIIDFGDAIYTQTINDLAICIAYGVMNKPDPLQAACKIVKGYHASFSLKDEELKLLYILVACRLIISVSKSAINKEREPENNYLQVSEKPAWELLYKWREIDQSFMYYSFRKSCNLPAHPKEKDFAFWAKKTALDISFLLKNENKKKVFPLDLSVSSKIIGLEENLEDIDFLRYQFIKIEKENPNSVLGGGYLEPRIIYSTDSYKKKGNNGTEWRTQHLGIDFWLTPETPIYSLFDGEVYSIYDNGQGKDYGPTLIIHHRNADVEFYTLYGHLSKSTLELWKDGQQIKKGDLLGYVGDVNENGNWYPHLHFQIILDLLGNKVDFPGVAFPNEIEVWESLCPDPNLIFKSAELAQNKHIDTITLLESRKKYLGKGLSLSYDKPLQIARGSGAFLIDEKGQRFLDTVNNVAHCGHEHPRVVKAGQDQMAVLNTNTRYLHPSITEMAENLIHTFPDKLSVVHFVNSGSEANELALRMAKTYTNQQDIIAVEVGYHGNTNACVDISSYKFDGKGGNGAPEHTHIIPLPDAYRGLYQGDDCGSSYASHVNEQIEKVEKKGRGVAAFICESIISCGGQIELPKGFLKKTYEEVRKAGALCIADEVQVGLGRVGKTFWGFQLHDVIPDIVTIGKPLGNGHPFAAVVCTEEVANAFANGMEYFNTFGGNPVSCSIGLEVLKVIKEEKLQENALIVGDYLKGELKTLQNEFPILGDIRGQGLFLGVELVDKDKNPLAEKATYLANRMRDLGILMSRDGKDNNVLKIKPPLVFSKTHAKELIHKLKHILQEDHMNPKAK